MSTPYAVTPFSDNPTAVPLRKISPACRMPSNSSRTRLPLVSGGSLKCLRYHTVPFQVPRSPPLCEAQVRKLSTSLYVCGVLTVSQAESSNAAAAASLALALSSLKNFQFRSRLYSRRGESAGVNFCCEIAEVIKSAHCAKAE